MKARKPWDVYFMEIAHLVASRHTCDRAAVGAVILREKNILSTGYNGAPGGLPHCDEAGHDIVDGHCVRAVHAEINAISQAAKHGVTTRGGTLHVTHYPCYHCMKSVINAGIEAIYFDIAYNPDPRVAEAARIKNIGLHQVEIAKKGERPGG